MYWYKRHPIYKVDIIGVVVKRQENARCFIYAGILIYCIWSYRYLLNSLCVTVNIGFFLMCLKSKLYSIFYYFLVDDGTGVITCCCWKSRLHEQSSEGDEN